MFFFFEPKITSSMKTTSTSRKTYYKPFKFWNVFFFFFELSSLRSKKQAYLIDCQLRHLFVAISYIVQAVKNRTWKSIIAHCYSRWYLNLFSTFQKAIKIIASCTTSQFIFHIVNGIDYILFETLITTEKIIFCTQIRALCLEP